MRAPRARVNAVARALPKKLLGLNPGINARAHPPGGGVRPRGWVDPTPRGLEHLGALVKGRRKGGRHPKCYRPPFHLPPPARAHTTPFVRASGIGHGTRSATVPHSTSPPNARTYDAFCQGERKGGRHPKCYRPPFRPHPLFHPRPHCIKYIILFCQGGGLEGVCPSASLGLISC